MVVPFTALRVNENRVFNPNNKCSCFTQYINNNNRGLRYNEEDKHDRQHDHEVISNMQ